MGYRAGFCMQGDTNIAIGKCALAGSTTASNNTGTDNLVIGMDAGHSNTSGTQNIFLGRQAGNTNTSGNRNIAIGYDVELPSATGSDQFAIGCGSSRWISGDSSFNIQPGAGLKDKDGDLGTSGQILSSTGTQLDWIDAASGGGSGEFNTGITSSIQHSVNGYETDVLTLASNSSKRYVLESLSVASVTSGAGSTANILVSVNPGVTTYNNDSKVYLAYNVPVPDNGLVELLTEPMVLNPSDVLKVWSTDSTYNGVSNALEMYASYTEQDDTNFISKTGSTNSVPGSTAVGIYTSSSKPTVLQSIKLTNRTDTGDWPVTIQIVRGSTITHLAKNLIVPRYSSVEILERPKRIETNDIIKMQLAQAGTIDAIVSGKKYE